MKQFEICTNVAKCKDAQKGDVKHKLGAFVCPECGEPLETMDTRNAWQKFGSVTNLNKVVPQIFGGGSSAAAGGSIVVSGGQTVVSSGKDEAKLTITIIGAGGIVFSLIGKDELDVDLPFIWDDAGNARPELLTNLIGGLVDNKITIGANNPWADWRPTVDVAAFCAHNTGLGSDGKRLPVTVSGHMATIERNAMGEFVVIGTPAKNVARRLAHDDTKAEPWSLGERLQPSETAVITDGDMFAMGDVYVRFAVE